MPRNDWPSIVDTRRTLVPKFRNEEKDIRPSRVNNESYRNCNGKGNINNLIMKSSAEIEGFHNSNYLYRGASGDKLRSELSRSPHMNRHEVLNN